MKNSKHLSRGFQNLLDRCLRKDRGRIWRRWRQLMESLNSKPSKSGSELGPSQETNDFHPDPGFEKEDWDKLAAGDQELRSLFWDHLQTGGKSWSRLAENLKRSLQLFSDRKFGLPKIVYNEELPINQYREEITDLIKNNQVIVLCGETGSGKSTQLPKLCLDAGLGISGFVGHTQPRRIAARSVATRLAEELKVSIGQEVGFKIRFHDDTSDKTYVKLMTDGILLAETQSDRSFLKYDAIILDEAHERSMNIDFLLGYLKSVCEKRPEFRLIITSATIDAERFAKHFPDKDGNPAPIKIVEGRNYPVDIQYRNPMTEDGDWVDWQQSVINALEELATYEQGHVLVFLPTERDILSLHRKIKNHPLGSRSSEFNEVIPLYARLSSGDQQKIFKATSNRRIVLSTNVAESSLTVPGIRYVVDTGTVRISRYSPRSKVQRLPIEAVSQASANQRAGRCGRIGPGICIRLYSEEDFQARDPYTTPEIRRTNLASVILQAKMLGLGSLSNFPFIDPPRPEAIKEGHKSLFEIGAIDTAGNLTDIGRQLGRMPIDPRIGRMILEASTQGCLEQILVIASAIEVQDPRVRPVDASAAADQAHQIFKHPKSDFLSYLKVWEYYHQKRSELSRSKLRRELHGKFLSPERMHQWIDVHRQLKMLARDLKLPHSRSQDDYAAIHRSLLAGLLSGVAQLDERTDGSKSYIGAGNNRFLLWPGTGLDKQPKWVIASEIVETSKRFGRTVASIDPSWIESLAQHLVKHRYSNIRWDQKACKVMANLRVSLFGLPIVPRRSVGYGKIDPKDCRLLMFSEGFFLENWDQPVPDFLQSNWELHQEVKELSDKLRQSSLFVDENKAVEFYDERIPNDVYDAATLNRYLKKISPEDLSALLMTQKDLLEKEVEYQPEDFPKILDVGSTQLSLQYTFMPGEDKDGVQLQVPVDAINQVSDQRLDWAVPGWVEPKLIQVIRSLPKTIRRNLVPAPDTAARVAKRMEFGEGSFFAQAAKFLSDEAQMPIQVSDFKTEKIDPYLTMGLGVLDEDGEILATGRTVAEVRSKLNDVGVEATGQIQDSDWEQFGLEDWPEIEIPKSVPLVRGEVQLEAFPAICPGQDSVEGNGGKKTVDLRLFDNQGVARHIHKTGICYLMGIKNKKSFKNQIRWLPERDQCRLSLNRWISGSSLDDQLTGLMSSVAFGDVAGKCRDKQAFEQLLSESVSRISHSAVVVGKWLPKLAAAVVKVDVILSEIKTKKQFVKPFNDARNQTRNLLAENFLQNTPWQWLQHYPRFLDAIGYRLERLDSGSVPVDIEKLDLVSEFWKRYEIQQEELDAQKRIDPELVTFRWMIEEYRVSLFAQPLGTSQKISAPRLEKQWAKVGQ